MPPALSKITRIVSHDSTTSHRIDDRDNDLADSMDDLSVATSNTYKRDSTYSIDLDSNELGGKLRDSPLDLLDDDDDQDYEVENMKITNAEDEPTTERLIEQKLQSQSRSKDPDLDENAMNPGSGPGPGAAVGAPFTFNKPPFQVLTADTFQDITNRSSLSNIDDDGVDNDDDVEDHHTMMHG